MAYGLPGSRRRRIAPPDPPETGRNPVECSALNANHRRGRLQTLFALLCALGVFAGIHLTNRRAHNMGALTERALQGVWELRSVGADPIGPNTHTDVLSQHVSFYNGRLHGDTRLLASTPAGANQMPFPDQSVNRVEVNTVENTVIVLWDGTYKLLDGRRMELKVGQALYRLEATLNPKTHVLTLDHDVILTYPGATRYCKSREEMEGKREE